MITGQKVVCVNDQFDFTLLPFYDMLPVKGNVYTVRDVMLGIDMHGEEGQIAITLVGLVNPRNAHGRENAFRAERFAPVDDAFVEEAISYARVEQAPVTV